MWKFLIIFFLIMFLLPKLAKFLFRGLFWSMEKKAREAAYQQQGGYQQANGHKVKKEGEIEVQYDPSQEKSDTKDFKGGDYIDYEEVKD